MPRTDITILGENSLTIIDAKFYAQALVQNRGAFKYRRDHLSQIMDYIRMSNREHEMQGNGILIYPTIGDDFDNAGLIEGLPIRVATVDLSKPWPFIREKLLGLISQNLTQAKTIAL